MSNPGASTYPCCGGVGYHFADCHMWASTGNPPLSKEGQNMPKSTSKPTRARLVITIECMNEDEVFLKNIFGEYIRDRIVRYEHNLHGVVDVDLKIEKVKPDEESSS